MVATYFAKSGAFATSLTIGALLLWGCLGEERQEFNVPVRNHVGYIQYKIEGDGTPVIMAEVGMNYTTKNPNEFGFRDTVYANSETVVFTRKKGVWARHAFRNLRGNGGKSSELLRNSNGQLQPLIYDRTSYSLFHSEGETWRLKRTVRHQQFGGDRFLNYGLNSIQLLGDSSWQTVTRYFGEKPRLEVVQPNGSKFVVDTASEFTPMVAVSTKDFNFLIGVDPNSTFFDTTENRSIYDSLPYYKMIVYSWSLDPSNPNPKKQIIPIKNRMTSAAIENATDQKRLFARTEAGDILEFTFKGRELFFTRNLVQPDEIEVGMETDFEDKPLIGIYDKLAIDQNGCIHEVKELFQAFSIKIGVNAKDQIQIGYVHSSSCSEELDSLIFPKPISDKKFRLGLSDLNIDADGNVSFAFTTKTYIEPSGLDRIGSPREAVKPSWIYFGILPVNANGKWQLEQVAEY